MYFLKLRPAAVLWMSSWMTSIFLALTSAQTATTIGTGVNYPCTTTPIPRCYCEYPHYQETLGWSMMCLDSNNSISYKLEYSYSDPKEPSSDSEFTLTCGASQPLHQGFFSGYHGHGEEQSGNFIFHNCPLSFNASLVDVLVGRTVESLYLDCETCSPDPFVPQETRWTFGSLRSLTMKNYNLTVLSDVIFSELVSLTNLVLNADSISNIPDNLLVAQSKLEVLDLYDNLLEVLPAKLFNNLEALKTLNVKNNRIKEVGGDMFRSLVSIKVLDLGKNQIGTVNKDTFQFNAKLTTLILSENKLENINSGTFDHNVALEYLDLRSNPALSDLPETMGPGIINLREFFLCGCNISTLPENLLLSAHNLTRFEALSNSIEKIPSRLFANTFSLTSLNLSKNEMSSLPEDVFLNTPNLQFLSLAYNRFTKFPYRELQNLEQLEELDLEGNLLTEFGNLNGLSSLTKVMLQNNAIGTVLGGRQPFGRATNLSFVDLAHNKLQVFLDLDWAFYPSLKTLNLQYNEITVLDITTMTSREIDVHLENNNITCVLVKDVEKAESEPLNHNSGDSDAAMQNLYLKDNPLNCDCRMLEFQRYIKSMWKRLTRFSDRGDLVCSSPSNLANVSFVSVEEKDFVCSIEDDCPEGCTCVFRVLYNAREVECAKQNRTALPDAVPVNTSVLNFQNNLLTSLDGLQKPEWQNLTFLNVDDNYITSDDFYIPESLRSLSIQRNSLIVVPSLLDSWANTSAQSLSLGGNPWQCDCAGIALKHLLADQYKIVSDRDKVLCAKPASLFQKSVAGLQEKDLCPNNKNSDRAYIVAISVCVPIVLLFLVLSVVYYRNRKMIIAYIYIHCYKIFVILYRESDMDEDKPYHAFVSYSSSDTKVVKALVEELEKKEPHFRLCIHERDWLPGQLITWNIVRSVQNSRRTILILSRDFLKSVWFQLEFHIAYYQMMEDKVDRLIVVVNGDLPDKKDMDSDLQFLLSTKSYLIWNERWFWEKLRYALPHKRGQTHAPSSRPEVQCPSSDLLQKIEGKIMSLTERTVENQPPSKEQISFELQEIHRDVETGIILNHKADRSESMSV